MRKPSKQLVEAELGVYVVSDLIARLKAVIADQEKHDENSSVMRNRLATYEETLRRFVADRDELLRILDENLAD